MERKKKELKFGSIFSKRVGEEMEILYKCFRVEWKGIEKEVVLGIFKLYVVVLVDLVSIVVRDIFCYCLICIKDVLNGCYGWKVNRLIKLVNE